MLVFISDLHLADGTAAETLDVGAAYLFADRLQDLAWRASWRADGSYRPVDRIDVILLGDTLDLITSRRWLSGVHRPWSQSVDGSGHPTPAHCSHAHGSLAQVAGTIDETTARITGEIVEGILAANGETTDVFRSLASGQAIQLEPVDASGRPLTGYPPVGVPIRLHMMVGDRDWLLHADGPGMNFVRQRVAHAFGLANVQHEPFPHDPLESDEVLALFREHRVVARHGDRFDPLTYSGDRAGASLADVIQTELTLRFIGEVTEQLGDVLPVEVRMGLPEIARLDPVLLAPVYLEGLLARAETLPAVRAAVRRLWDELAIEMLSLPVMRELSQNIPAEAFQELASLLRFGQQHAPTWQARIRQFHDRLRGTTGESYAVHAGEETEFRNRRARFVIFGHTGVAESVPLDASRADGYTLTQHYLNTGAWRRSHQPARLSPTGQEFITSETMRLVAIYQGDERGGRTHETWTGEIDTRSTVPAIPPRGVVHSSHQGVGRPHFATQPSHHGMSSEPARRRSA